MRLRLVLDVRVHRRIRPLARGGNRGAHHSGVRARNIEIGMKVESGDRQMLQVPSLAVRAMLIEIGAKLRVVERSLLQRRRSIGRRDRMRSDVSARRRQQRGEDDRAHRALRVYDGR